MNNNILTIKTKNGDFPFLQGQKVSLIQTTEGLKLTNITLINN